MSDFRTCACGRVMVARDLERLLPIVYGQYPDMATTPKEAFEGWDWWCACGRTESKDSPYTPAFGPIPDHPARWAAVNSLSPQEPPQLPKIPVVWSDITVPWQSYVHGGKLTEPGQPMTEVVHLMESCMNVNMPVFLCGWIPDFHQSYRGSGGAESVTCPKCLDLIISRKLTSAKSGG